MIERRSEPRLTLAGELQGTIKSSIPVQVLDMSAGGMRIRTPSGLAPGSACELTLDAASGRLRVRAQVLRCRACQMDGRMCYAAGLKFDGSPDNQQVVRTLLDSYQDPTSGAPSDDSVLRALIDIESGEARAIN